MERVSTIAAAVWARSGEERGQGAGLKESGKIVS
jgi:hypothetical protein